MRDQKMLQKVIDYAAKCEDPKQALLMLEVAEIAHDEEFTMEQALIIQDIVNQAQNPLIKAMETAGSQICHLEGDVRMQMIEYTELIFKLLLVQIH